MLNRKPFPYSRDRKTCPFCEAPVEGKMYPDRESGVGPGWQSGIYFKCGSAVTFFGINQGGDVILQSWGCEKIVSLKNKP
jgi:hypothetical protein